MRLQIAQLLMGLCFLLVPGAARAAPDMMLGEDAFTLDMSGLSVTAPLPYWSKDRTVSSPGQLNMTMTNPRPDLSTLILRKNGENAVLWSEIMGIIAIHVPGYPAALHFKSIAEPVAGRCAEGAWTLFWIPAEEGEGREALVGLCGRYRLDARSSDPCDGTILTAIAIEKPEGMVSAYAQWCTPRFDVGDDTRWPVSRGEIEARARLFQESVSFAEAGR